MITPPQRTNVSKAAKNTATISLLKTVGSASTLLIDIAVAARFGFSGETDAFFLAFTVPRLIWSVLLVSANAVLVPIFTRKLSKEGQDRLWGLVSNLVNISLLVMGAVGVLGILVSPVLMRVLGLALYDATRALSVSLSMILFLMVIPAGANEVCVSLLNAMRIFGLPEGTILLRNLATLGILLWLAPTYGIYSVAMGYSTGAFLQLAALLVIMIVTKHYRYQLTFDFADEQTRYVFRQLRYPIIGAMFGQSSIVVERFLASFLPVGSISQLAYARRLFGALDRIFAGSVSTAFLPRFSAQFSVTNMANYRHSVTLALKMTLFISAPVAAGIIVLSPPTVELLFGRGVADAASLEMISLLFSVFALAIPITAANRILRMAYYSFDDTMTPFRNRMWVLALNIVIDIILLPFMGVVSLPIGFVVSLCIVTLYMFLQLGQQIDGYEPGLARFTAKIAVASAIMAGLVLVANRVFVSAGHLNIPVRLAPAVLLGILSYTAALLMLRVDEVSRFAGAITSRAAARS
jgi:putative peptidoglycan lipid II flippase